MVTAPAATVRNFCLSMVRNFWVELLPPNKTAGGSNHLNNSMKGGERMARKFFKPRPIYVRCNQCGEQYDEEKVEFVNIEEGMQGQDILTFKCPNPDCKGTSKSERRG